MTPSQKIAAIAALALLPTASFADTRGGGETQSSNFLMTLAADEVTDNWNELQLEHFNLTSTSNIIVTACADVDNPGGTSPNTYLFTIELDTLVGGLNGAAERTVDDLYDDPAKNDPDVVAVCTTRFFALVPPGEHDIRFLGAKASNSMLDVNILDRTMVIGSFSGGQL